MKNEEYEIIRRILAGNTHDYESLVHKYQASVYNLLYQMLHLQEEAEELAQDVFVKAYEKLGTFNFQSRFFSWIYRIAINTAISHQKMEQRFVRLERLSKEPDHNQTNSEGQMINKERDAILKQAIGMLKENYRAVIVLHYFEQLSYAEIAEVLEVSEKKVKSRLFDGRRMLKTMLEKQEYFI